MTLWLDVATGVAGDLLLAAFVDAGVPIEVPGGIIDRLLLDIELRAETVTRSGLAATRVHVHTPDEHVHRHLSDITGLLDALPPTLAADAMAVFERLAIAEAAVHASTVEEVHFHEVGALDAIADIVGVISCWHHLGRPDVVASPIGVGRGRARAAHGSLPVPVPAVLELTKGVAPIHAGPLPFEAATPTGVALVCSLATSFGPIPPLTVRSIGVGAGTKDPEGIPNVVRVVVGDD